MLFQVCVGVAWGIACQTFVWWEIYVLEIALLSSWLAIVALQVWISRGTTRRSRATPMGDSAVRIVRVAPMQATPLTEALAKRGTRACSCGAA